MLVVRLHRSRIHRLWQRERARKAAIAPLDPVEVLFLFVLLELALTFHRQRLVLHLNVQVFLLDSRDLQLQHQLLRVLVYIHRRDEVPHCQ